MDRFAFCLRLRPGTGEAYDRAHRDVWPEMLELLRTAGISDYSIFRCDQTVVLIMRCNDFDHAWDIVERSPINTRWQQTMAEFFEPTEPLHPGEHFSHKAFPMMREIFFMP